MRIGIKKYLGIEDFHAVELVIVCRQRFPQTVHRIEIRRIVERVHSLNDRAFFGNV